MAIKGTISEWYIDKGYGYIIPDAGAVRIKFLLEDVKNSVNVGEIRQPVRFIIAQDDVGNRRATNVEGTRSFPWMTLIVAWFFSTLCGCVFFWQYPISVLYYYLVASLVLLLVYGFDKYNEKRKKSVTGESAILFLSIVGGWAGAATGQYLFNLKPKSPVFVLLFGSVVLAHIGFLAWSLTPLGGQQFHHWVDVVIRALKMN